MNKKMNNYQKYWGNTWGFFKAGGKGMWYLLQSETEKIKVRTKLEIESERIKTTKSNNNDFKRKVKEVQEKETKIDRLKKLIDSNPGNANFNDGGTNYTKENLESEINQSEKELIPLKKELDELDQINNALSSEEWVNWFEEKACSDAWGTKALFYVVFFAIVYLVWKIVKKIINIFN